MAEIVRPEPGLPDPVEYAELAVATYSPLLLVGPPGAGRTMLARRIPTIMPRLSADQAEDLAHTYTQLGLGRFHPGGERPFRAPHHTISAAAMVGTAKRPGELQLARYGVLFLDDLDEFRPTQQLLDGIARVLSAPGAPLIVASLGQPLTSTERDIDEKEEARIVSRLEQRWFRFPLKLYMKQSSLVDVMRGHREAGESGDSAANPRSSAAIRARIASYDEDDRRAAHDLVEEGRIAEAWRVLRGQAVERVNPRSRRNPALTKKGVIDLFKEMIQQPGIASIAVAQDMLLEQNVTLADASASADTWLGEPPSDSFADLFAWGLFVIHGHMKRGTWSDDYTAVEWDVRPLRGDLSRSLHPSTDTGFYATWSVIADGTKQSVEPDRTNFPTRNEAIYHAVAFAWVLVKLVKHIGPAPEMVPIIAAVENFLWARRDGDVEEDYFTMNHPPTPRALISEWGEGEDLRADLIDRNRQNPARGEAMPSKKALRLYVGFHQKDPKKVGNFDPRLVIPAEAQLIGHAVHVLYRSDKLNPTTGEDEGWIDYIHEHDANVKVYRCDRSPGGPEGITRRVPAWLQRVDELDWLGYCQGFAFEDDDGEKEVKGTKPYPELYCTPNGKALLVIQSKRTLLAMIWGGRLGVEPRGIVH